LFRWEEVLFFSGAKKTPELDKNFTIDCFIRAISSRLREKTKRAFFSLLEDAYYRIRLERSYNPEELGFLNIEDWRWSKYNLFQDQYYLWYLESYSNKYQYFKDFFLEKYGYNFIRVVDFESLLEYARLCDDEIITPSAVNFLLWMDANCNLDQKSEFYNEYRYDYHKFNFDRMVKSLKKSPPSIWFEGLPATWEELDKKFEGTHS